MTERNIGVVLSDIDGTQIIHGEQFPSVAVQAAARRLRANRIPLLEVTGRSYSLMRELAIPLDLRDNLCTLDGGATVAHAGSGEVVWSRWLPAELTQSIVTNIGRLCTDIYFDKDSQRRTPSEAVMTMKNGRLTVEATPSVFAIFGTEKGKDIIKALGKLSGIKHTPIMGYENSQTQRCIQVVEASVDKQSGIKRMLDYAHLGNRRTLAIGDGMNDIPLFAAAGPDGIKVAMGNAPHELKDIADWVAPSVDDDGFAIAMERYGLTTS